MPCVHFAGSLWHILGFPWALQWPLVETQRLLMVHRTPLLSLNSEILLCLAFGILVLTAFQRYNVQDTVCYSTPQKNLWENSASSPLSTHQVEAMCLLRISQSPIDSASGFPLGNFSRTLWLPPEAFCQPSWCWSGDRQSLGDALPDAQVLSLLGSEAQKKRGLLERGSGIHSF